MLTLAPTVPRLANDQRRFCAIRVELSYIFSTKTQFRKEQHRFKRLASAIAASRPFTRVWFHFRTLKLSISQSPSWRFIAQF